MKTAASRGFLLLMLGFLAPGFVQGQEITCAMDDDFCLQRYTERACREPGASRTACEAWLGTLEEHRHAEEPGWQLARGWVLMSLADFASVTALPDYGSVSEVEATAYRARAAELFKDVYRRSPDDPEAVMSMVAVAGSHEEKVRLLRQAVKSDPGAFIPAESLVSELLSASTAPPTYLEAADILRGVYINLEAVARKWKLAVQIDQYYALSGDIQRREAFRSALVQDLKLGLDGSTLLRSEVAAARQARMSSHCDASVRSLFSDSPCLNIIDAAMQVLPGIQEEAEKLDFAEHLASLMAMLADSPLQASAMQQTRQAFQDNFASIFSSGLESAELLNHYATLLEGEQQIPVLEKAVLLEPDNGELRYRLALLYLNREDWASAAAQLQSARDHLPEWKLPYLEQQLSKAEARMSTQ